MIVKLEDKYYAQLIVGLYTDLDNLCVWPKNWQLRFNLDKCKKMGKCNVMRQYSTQDDSGQMTVLQDTVEEKDLGIWMDSSLKFSVHVAHAAAKANQILGLIRRSFVYLDITLMKQLYISMVRPHFEYGNVVWHPMLKKDQGRVFLLSLWPA